MDLLQAPVAIRSRFAGRLARLEKQAVSPKYEVLWVDVHSGETHEGAIKAHYGDQIPPGVEPVTVSWMPQVSRNYLLSACSRVRTFSGNHVYRYKLQGR